MSDTSFLERLKGLGFTHVSFDMARAVSITAWRGNERKTYSVYHAPTLAAAEADLLKQIERKPAPIANPFEDLLG